MDWTIGVVPQRPSTTRAPAVLKITQERPNKEKPEKADNKKKGYLYNCPKKLK